MRSKELLYEFYRLVLLLAQTDHLCPCREYWRLVCLLRNIRSIARVPRDLPRQPGLTFSELATARGTIRG